MFIKKGDMPIESERHAILMSNLNISREKCSTLFLSQSILTIQISAITCARMVAIAAPRMPILNTKMKIGSMMVLSTTASMVASIARRGRPEERTVPLRP